MELEIDLLGKRRKSHFRIVFGILCLLGAGVWITIGITEKSTEVLFFVRILNGLLFILMGINYLMEGLGYSLERFFGKAYILIDSESISVKPSIYKKEQLVNWNEIKSIEYKLNKFIIQKTDDTTIFISLSEFDYLLRQEIKKTINCIAKEKNI